MATFVLTFVIVLVSIAGLAAGVLLGREPLGGACAGCTACKAHRNAEVAP
jgi:hypothetical protein